MSDIPDLLKKLFYNQHVVCVCVASQQNTVCIEQTQFTYTGHVIGNEDVSNGPHNFKGSRLGFKSQLSIMLMLGLKLGLAARK